MDYEHWLKPAHALVAWLDGPQVDDGTACEIGVFHGLTRGDLWRKGMRGLGTDPRLQRRRPAFSSGGSLVAGAIARARLLERRRPRQILAWRRQLDERSG